MSSKPPVSAREFFNDDDANVGFNRLWFNMMRAHRHFYPVITKALKAHGLNDPIWYEILLQIHRGGPDGKLMGRLRPNCSCLNMPCPGTFHGWKRPASCGANSSLTAAASRCCF